MTPVHVYEVSLSRRGYKLCRVQVASCQDGLRADTAFSSRASRANIKHASLHGVDMALKIYDSEVSRDNVSCPRRIQPS